MSKKIVLSDVLIRGVNAVYNDVAYEIEYEGSETDRERYLILAEVCIDAGRLTTWGHPEADAEVKRLVEVHGYDAVLNEIAQFVSRA